MKEAFTLSELPGAFERHLFRKHNNPLFGVKGLTIDEENLNTARQRDEEIFEKFGKDFNETISRISEFGESVDSEVIYQSKADLDHLYIRASSVGGDTGKSKEAIKSLLEMIMSSIKKGVGEEESLLAQLEDEELARVAHFGLLESQMIADLLGEEEVIAHDELVPTLLSASKKDLALSIQLFDKQQASLIVEQSESWLKDLEESGIDTSAARENYTFIQGYLRFIEAKEAEMAERTSEEREFKES